MRHCVKTLLFACLACLPVLSYGAEDTLLLGDGISIRVLYFEPAETANPPPLAILLTGGANNEFMARAQFWLGKEMVDRGWSIAVPISDQGRKFFVENGGLMPEIVDQLKSIHAIAESKPLLLGISSGGSAALAVAAQHPQAYLGVIATPGRIWDETRFQDLAELPIFLRIGEKDDFRWNRKMAETVATLESAGAKVDAALMPGAHHVFTLNWDEIEDWLGDLKN